MASSSCSLSSLMIFLVVVTFVSPICSTSRRALIDPKAMQIGFRVDLKHVDSGGNRTKFERLQRAMKRGNFRLQRLNEMVAKTDSEVSSPVYHGKGEFLMNLSIGTPPEPYSAIMDTGSDIIWTQCKPCQQCFDVPTPVFDPTKSSSFSQLPCSSSLCSALQFTYCGTDGCEYLYRYGFNSLSSSIQGAMATETFTFGKVSVPNIEFGCGKNHTGSAFSIVAGLVGLSRGPLSLVSQLGAPKFSYCLTSIYDSSETSTLLIGSLAIVNSTGGKNSIITTPLIPNPSKPYFYYFSLQGITVGDTALPITFPLNQDGSGGIIIDSGTTITYLEQSTFDLVKKEFISQTRLSVDKSGSTGLDLCFTLPSNASVVDVTPKLVFHFDGADMELPFENYMIQLSDMGLMCLAMNGSSFGMSVFGNVQQQNMMVIHDLAKETLSLIPTQCNQL
ncbi:Aspartic proteinase nepenthesin-1 [Camellia lanceoleosa]|uniref:Aspartic proteinase nepenthesin-1 n=1 Tax=Camellia lanceoleosa TaxID=1840588 RepID=A0ACC0J2H0_9ERIC|nr:Aspartic proteinase nepenthesin-1 [Camellia lanceoleosa]